MPAVRKTNQKLGSPRPPRPARSAGKRLCPTSDLEELWKEKYKFNLTKLNLPKDKAEEWADRTINAVRQSEVIT